MAAAGNACGVVAALSFDLPSEIHFAQPHLFINMQIIFLPVCVLVADAIWGVQKDYEAGYRTLVQKQSAKGYHYATAETTTILR